MYTITNRSRLTAARGHLNIAKLEWRNGLPAAAGFLPHPEISKQSIFVYRIKYNYSIRDAVFTNSQTEFC